MTIHPFKSVFVKLLSAYMVAFVLIGCGALAVRFLAANSKNIDISMNNIRNYASILTDQIGTPPVFSVAQSLSDETGIQIEINGTEVHWSSSGDLIEDESWPIHDDDLLFFFSKADPIIEIERADYEYLFMDFHTDYHMSASVWLIMSFSILAALVISYLMVHHLLKPLREMNAVALGFGVSDWKQRVRPRGSDELATLGRTLNSMADRIEQYVLSIHDLLVAVSHELRSPLTRMKVALEFIDNPRIKDSLNEEIDILDRMTGHLLEQRRLTTQRSILNTEEVKLQDWVESVCNPYLVKGRTLTIVRKGLEKTASLDRGRMDILLRNLIENCLRHAPGSPIEVLIDTSSSQGFILEVSDEGPGMPESLIGRSGEPFLLGDSSRAGKRSGGGFGLGLSIVKAVAEAHGATFTAGSRIPSGFSVTLQFFTKAE
ncbi:HAMP domain-containing sensor histidine kinase [Oceanispirochaeta sp.]|jgi:signal transduction histidine kinase|uniref:HAMP domain-containing sensor histidine kinase n=1 Tax=Oceanispirochaeta sp. TaxID=2035350 RepID=UPI0026023061|nr:HAMP domain-containing sensor histidine kinase [Oceanispirochaeta sp.]MDA3957944.1 HAMP domain-containing sensor histidine kinase [Oceanispirochaeta sp.]